MYERILPRELVEKVCKKRSKELRQCACKLSGSEEGKKVFTKSSKELGKCVCKKSSKE